MCQKDKTFAILGLLEALVLGMAASASPIRLTVLRFALERRFALEDSRATLEDCVGVDDAGGENILQLEMLESRRPLEAPVLADL